MGISYGNVVSVARRQVIVQLDDDLVDALDAEAETIGVNRSELIRRAATALLAAHDTLRRERVHTDAYRRDPQDPALTEAFTKIAVTSTERW